MVALRWSVEIPDLTPSQNKLQRMHWSARKRLQEGYILGLTVDLKDNPPGFPLWRFKRMRRDKGVKFCESMRDGTRSPCMQPTVKSDVRGLHWCYHHWTKGRLIPKPRHVLIERASAGELDQGNFIGGCKPLLDALVIVGLLYDDTRQYSVEDYKQLSAKRNSGLVRITVTDE